MPKPLGVRILGTGSAIPDQVVTNQYFIDRLETTEEWIYERTGIRERRMVSDKESTATLAATAGRKAIEEAGLKPSDIDMVMVASITPECAFPSTACFVQEALGLPPTPAFDLSAACTGFIYGFMLGSFAVATGAYRNILVIGAETMSRITDYEDRATCILFGDGAAAAVISASPGTPATGPCVLHHKLCAENSGLSMLSLPAGGSHMPASQMTINERLHYIKMQGREVYKLAVKRNLEMVETTLGEAGVKPQDVAMVIPHQSNMRIIESAREKLGLPPGKMFTNIQKYGNTSAASIPLGLDECRKTGRLRSGDLVLMVAFGAGFTWGSILLRL